MAKTFEIVCPYCKGRRTMEFADSLLDVANTIALGSAPMTGGTIGKILVSKLFSKLFSANSEQNWFDLKEPCPNCKRTFSINIFTGESKE